MTDLEIFSRSNISFHTYNQQIDTERVSEAEFSKIERQIVRRIDVRLCSIAGVLCSLNLIDSGIISSASVSTIFEDLDLGVGSRYSISILVYTLSCVIFQMPCMILLRIIGPRMMFSLVTVGFGVITLCTAFINSWKQMVLLRIMLGIMKSAIFPGLTLLISTWYTKKEQQLRLAFVQSGEVVFLGFGNLINFGLVHLEQKCGLAGWSWIFLVNGLIAIVIELVTYLLIVEFPKNSHESFKFLTAQEQEFAQIRIQKDRGDVNLETFSWGKFISNFADFKLYGFSLLFFLLNLVTTCLAYFLPIILQSVMGFSSKRTILFSALPYIYAVLPVLITSFAGDYYQLRGLSIIFNFNCTIIGFVMLGFSSQVVVRYIGIFLATGAYISNWPAMNAFQTSNIVGQWKRTTFAAAIAACTGMGGIAGSFIIRPEEAPRYYTAVWIGIGSHIMIIVIVVLFFAYYWYSNEMQRKGEKLIEKTVDFKYVY